MEFMKDEDNCPYYQNMDLLIKSSKKLQEAVKFIQSSREKPIVWEDENGKRHETPKKALIFSSLPVCTWIIYQVSHDSFIIIHFGYMLDLSQIRTSTMTLTNTIIDVQILRLDQR